MVAVIEVGRGAGIGSKDNTLGIGGAMGTDGGGAVTEGVGSGTLRSLAVDDDVVLIFFLWV